MKYLLVYQEKIDRLYFVASSVAVAEDSIVVPTTEFFDHCYSVENYYAHDGFFEYVMLEILLSILPDRPIEQIAKAVVFDNQIIANTYRTKRKMFND